MKCVATIHAQGDPELLAAAITKEVFANDRTGFSFEKSADGIIITITSQDAVAFRATTNAVTALLAVFDKVQAIVE